MIGVLGLALLCASVLLLFYVARRRNGPNPPPWSHWWVTAHATLTVFLVGSLVGSALMLLPIFQKDSANPGFMELISALVVAAATVTLWRMVKRLPMAAPSDA